jgi:hypothetical protein
MLNATNWNTLTNLPISYTSECSYFVLTVDSSGTLMGGNASQESTFVANVHTAGKKATFSIGGSAQNSANLLSAMSSPAFISNIIAHLQTYSYDGVTLDFENTSCNPILMANFINSLRVALDAYKPGLIIGVYVATWEANTVWANTKDFEKSIQWLSPMEYDGGPYNKTTMATNVNMWVGMMNGKSSKVLAGVAVNYPATSGGLTTSQYGEVLDMVTQYNWGGCGIWQSQLFTQPWRDIQKTKFPVIG